jgi:hypothetical protein
MILPWFPGAQRPSVVPPSACALWSAIARLTSRTTPDHELRHDVVALSDAM